MHRILGRFVGASRSSLPRRRRPLLKLVSVLIGIVAIAATLPPSPRSAEWPQITPAAAHLLHTAIIMLDCRVLHPSEAQVVPSWCVRNAAVDPGSRTALEVLALHDGIERLKRSGFADAMKGLTVLHFARDPSAVNFAPALLTTTKLRGNAPEVQYALSVVRELGHSYYLHEQQVMVVRPQYWESDVRREMFNQFRFLKPQHLDPVTFPVYLSLYHEFGHRLLDHATHRYISGSKASETAADLFAAAMISQQYALSFTRVARALAKSRQLRESMEDDVHRNANLLMASLDAMNVGEEGPPPAFSAIRKAVFAMADTAIASAHAHIPEPPRDSSCPAPAGFAYPDEVRPFGRDARVGKRSALLHTLGVDTRD